MSNMSNWPDLIHTASSKGTQWNPDDSLHTAEFMMIPVDEYQLGNLAGLLKRAASMTMGTGIMNGFT